MIADLIRAARTFRRFRQDVVIELETMRELVDLARLGGSARNAQPLKYMLINDPETCAVVFPNLGWAGYLADWPGPVEGERPSAYIICLLDTGISRAADFDLGIATQNILLGATARGLGGCRIASLSPKLAPLLKLPDHLKLQLVLALGKPQEVVILEETGVAGDIRYWRDDSQGHHVPKRPLDEIIYSS